MADEILAEALARLEHKVDVILHSLKLSGSFAHTGTPMHFPGQVCPLCNSLVDYQIELTKGVVVRKCKCTTGKVAPTIPLVPVPTGVTNGKPDTRSKDTDAAGETSEERRSR